MRNLQAFGEHGTNYVAYGKNDTSDIFIATLDDEPGTLKTLKVNSTNPMPFAVRSTPFFADQFVIYTAGDNGEVFANLFVVPKGVGSMTLTMGADSDNDVILGTGQDVPSRYSEITQLFTLGTWLYVMYTKDSNQYVDRYRTTSPKLYARTLDASWTIPQHYTSFIPYLNDVQGIVCFDDMSYDLKLVWSKEDGRKEENLTENVDPSLKDEVIPGSLAMHGEDIMYATVENNGMADIMLTYREYDNNGQPVPGALKTEKFSERYTFKDDKPYESDVKQIASSAGDDHVLYFYGPDGGIHKATSPDPMSL